MAQNQNLQQLVALAQEGSSEKRRELLENISDMFLSAPSDFNERETALVGDIIGTIADDVEQTVRAHLSERLSDIDSAPRSLVMKLANDVIEVAGPQLLKSKVLQDTDLIKIIAERGQTHQLAISKRDTVSEVVADALVDRGDDKVLVSLVQNEGATLSRGAMESLVARSEHVADLQSPLIKRSDIASDLKSDMYWWVSAALREYLVNEIGGDEEEVDALLQQTASIAAGNPAQTQKMREAEKNIDKLERRGVLNQEAMVQLLREGKREEFVHAFARLTKVDVSVTGKVLADVGFEAVAIACRATGFDLSTFSAIVLLYDPEASTRGNANVAELLDTYMKLPEASAQRAMRFWRVRMKTRGG